MATAAFVSRLAIAGMSVGVAPSPKSGQGKEWPDQDGHHDQCRDAVEAMREPRFHIRDLRFHIRDIGLRRVFAAAGFHSPGNSGRYGLGQFLIGPGLPETLRKVERR